MNRITLSVAVFAAAAWLTLSAGVALAADAPTVDEIVQKANYVAYYQGADGKADVRMSIMAKGGSKQNRRFSILRRDLADKDTPDPKFTGEQKFYVYFHEPADVNKMAFLVHKHMDKDDDRWLYLPALDLVKRIASSDKRTSFVGSHFYYEDVSGRNVDADTHELAETTKDYYVLKNTPKDPKSVEFAYYKMWIHKTTFLVVQTSYYDAQDKEYRRYKASGVKQIEGFWTVVKSEMHDLRDGGHTVLEYDSVDYNVGLPDDIFTERYLRQAPMQHLK